MDKRTARYDGHADFYDELFAGYMAPDDSPGFDLTDLLGRAPEGGWCLDVACGTGFAGVV